MRLATAPYRTISDWNMSSSVSGSRSPPPITVVPGKSLDCLHAAIVFIVDKDVLPPVPIEGYGNTDGVPTCPIFKEKDFSSMASFLDWKLLDVVLVVVSNCSIDFVGISTG